MGDPVKIAEVVLERGNEIISTLEKNWKKLLPNEIMMASEDGTVKPSPRLLEFDAIKDKQIHEIRQEIDSMKALTRQSDMHLFRSGSKSHLDNNKQLIVSDEIRTQTFTPTVNDIVSSYRNYKKPDSEENKSTSTSSGDERREQEITRRLAEKTSSRKKRKTKREAITQELSLKLDMLEKEIMALKNDKEVEAKKNLVLDTLDIDVSPTKSLRCFRNDGGSIEEMPPLELPSASTVSPMKRTVSNLNVGKPTFTVRTETKAKNTGKVKAQLVETERIMNEGFRTARELNDRLELLKVTSGRRKSRTVGLQVSVPATTRDEHSQRNEEKKSKVNKYFAPIPQDNSSTTCHHCCSEKLIQNVSLKQIENIQSAPTSPRKRNLVVQMLPSINIRGTLTKQSLPCISISPTECLDIPPINNASVTVLQHGQQDEKKETVVSETDETIETLLREVIAMDPKPTIIPEFCKHEIGLQTSLSQREVSTIEDHIDKLSKKVESRLQLKKLRKDIMGDEVDDLLKKVAETKEKCDSLRQKRINKLFINSEEQKPKSSNIKFDEPVALEEEKAVSLSSISMSLKEKTEEDYESDFEADSMALDEQVHSSKSGSFDKEFSKSPSLDSDEPVKELKSAKTPVTPLTAKITRKSERTKISVSASADKIRKKLESYAVPSTSKHSPEIMLESPLPKSPSSPVVMPADRSLIEEQMKRLGLSPEKMLSKRLRKSEKRKSEVTAVLPQFLDGLETDTRGDRNFQKLEEVLYIKSNGQFIPVDPLKAPQVNIIVPEIVVKMPEKPPKDLCSAPMLPSPPNKLDQLVQTDEGCYTLTSGDTTSVVDKINQHFEKTQKLLDSLDVKWPVSQRSSRRKKKTLLDNLHIRVNSSDSSSSSNYGAYNSRFGARDLSSGEVHSRHKTFIHRKQRMQTCSSPSEGELDGSNSRSIGEVPSSDCR